MHPFHRPTRLPAATLLLLLAACAAPQTTMAPTGAPTPQHLRDISGLAWVEGDQFLVVHDAKDPTSPRVTLVQAPSGPGGILIRPLAVDWPDPLGISHDLESLVRIPDLEGPPRFLLAESGDNGRGSQRIFVAEFHDGDFRILETVDWPEPVFNVEAIALARTSEGYLFLYAERSQGLPSTTIRFTPIDFEPLRFGAFQGVEFEVPTDLGVNRPIVDMVVDGLGRLFAAAAYDPDEDGGPFSSGILEIGQVVPSAQGASLSLHSEPRWVTRAQGLKIEGITVRGGPEPLAPGRLPELFYGTDDEHYGGILRPIPRHDP